MKKILQQLGQYRRDTFQCIALTAMEVVMEILLPFVTSISLTGAWKPAAFPPSTNTEF